MRVNITKDYWNGQRSKTAQTDLDGFNMASLAYMLMESGVASVTITQVESLEKMIQHSNTPAPEPKE